MQCQAMRSPQKAHFFLIRTRRFSGSTVPPSSYAKGAIPAATARSSPSPWTGKASSDSAAYRSAARAGGRAARTSPRPHPWRPPPAPDPPLPPHDTATRSSPQAANHKASGHPPSRRSRQHILSEKQTTTPPPPGTRASHVGSSTR